LFDRRVEHKNIEEFEQNIVGKKIFNEEHYYFYLQE